MSKVVQIGGKFFDCYLTNSQLQHRIGELGKQISLDYSTDKLHLLIVLSGAFRFAADLSAQITCHTEVSFVKVSSYAGEVSNGNVTLEYLTNQDLSGKHVLLIEDIVDTGTTLEYLLSLDAIKAAKSLKIASLLFKPTAYKKDFQIDYVGFSIPDLFVVGYGLDYNGLGRNLNDIYQLN